MVCGAKGKPTITLCDSLEGGNPHMVTVDRNESPDSEPINVVKNLHCQFGEDPFVSVCTTKVGSTKIYALTVPHDEIVSSIKTTKTLEFTVISEPSNRKTDFTEIYNLDEKDCSVVGVKL